MMTIIEKIAEKVNTYVDGKSDYELCKEFEPERFERNNKVREVTDAIVDLFEDSLVDSSIGEVVVKLGTQLVRIGIRPTECTNLSSFAKGHDNRKIHYSDYKRNLIKKIIVKKAIEKAI